MALAISYNHKTYPLKATNSPVDNNQLLLGTDTGHSLGLGRPTMTKPSNRSQMHHKARQKPQTAKILDRLTYNPKKHKQKFIRSQRKLLQEKITPKTPTPNIQSSSIKFGSFNVNGLDLETNWAVNELLERREFDVIQTF